MSIPTLSHKVKKGETLASIAKARGFAGKDQKKIFAAQYNGKLRKLRKGPDTIEIGDIVNFPIVTAAKLDDLIKKLKAWQDALTLSLDSAHQLKNGELADLKEDRDRHLKRLKKIIIRVQDGPKIDRAKRSAALDCEFWFKVEDFPSISQIPKCGVLLSLIEAQNKEFLKGADTAVKKELQRIKEVQIEIWALEGLLAKSIKAERDVQSLLWDAIGIAKKLKASTF